MWLQRVKPLWHLEPLKRCTKPPWLVFHYSDSPQKKDKVSHLQETRMRDRCTIYAKGGEGGGGCSSVRRSRQDRHGTPDGGNGGRGGDVILECTPTVWDFSGLQPHIKAGRGGHGTSKNRIGTRGADKVVYVPVGTVVHLVKGEIPITIEKTTSSTDLDPWELPGTLIGDSSVSDQQVAFDSPGIMLSVKETKPASLRKPFLAESDGSQEEMQYNVAELTEKSQRIIVASGGEGGLGSVCSSNISRKSKFTKPEEEVSDDNNEPGLMSGSPGSEAVLVLELKSIADVGLVGIPNAGKSTLLGALSRAKPRVGHYAFTTLRPNLGNMNFDDFSITVADIPGLIKGAHVNRGLGHKFLRHIERTKVLAYVVDLSAGLDGRKGIPPWEQLRDLVLELEHHEKGLSDKPCIIVANKIDEAGAENVYEELERRVKGVPMYPVCAVLDEGVPEVKAGLKMLVNTCESSPTLTLEKINFD